MPELDTSDADDWVPTECIYTVTVDPLLGITHQYDPSNLLFEFTCPSEKLANNFDTFLARSDFLNVTFERGEAEGIRVLTRYLHPVNAWFGLQGILPGGFNLEEREGAVLHIHPVADWGNAHYASFVRSQSGILVTDRSGDVYVEIGQPNVWLNAQFLFSAFDWFEEGVVLPRIKQYLYPLSYALFAEQSL